MFSAEASCLFSINHSAVCSTMSVQSPSSPRPSESLKKTTTSVWSHSRAPCSRTASYSSRKATTKAPSFLCSKTSSTTRVSTQVRRKPNSAISCLTRRWSRLWSGRPRWRTHPLRRRVVNTWVLTSTSCAFWAAATSVSLSSRWTRNRAFQRWWT